jgi:hypothetical protein
MIYVLLIFIAIALVDLPPLIRDRDKRGIIVFGVIFVLGLALSILWVKDIRLPSPLVKISELMESIHLAYPR